METHKKHSLTFHRNRFAKFQPLGTPLFTSKAPAGKISENSRAPTSSLVPQAGSVSVVLLSIFPILLAAVFLAPTLLSHLYLISGTKSLCRNQLLDFQITSSRQLQLLDHLNDQVRILRAEDLALKVAMLGALSSANLAAIAQIKQAQLNLEKRKKFTSLQQKSLIATNQRLSVIEGQRLRRELTEHLLNNKRILSGFLAIDFVSAKAQLRPLAIVPDNPNAIPPIFVRQEPFTQYQAAQAFWSFRVSSQSSWLGNWLHFDNTWRDSCSASLKKKEGAWQSTLTEK